MMRAEVIACEKTGAWAVALRRCLEGIDVRIRETRSLADRWSELAARPASLLALEMTEDKAEAHASWREKRSPVFRGQ